MTASFLDDPFLVADRLCLGYGSSRVLEDVSFVVRGGKGLAIGLRGPNGAGKSTFLKACLGLHTPSSGSLRLSGVECGGKGFRSLASRLGYVPQARPAGQLRLTVGEVVWLGRYGRIGFLGRSRKIDRAAVRDAMERCGVVDLERRSVHELSGGQFQRVSIARALAGEPDILLLDEPGSHLDADGLEDIERLVTAIASERAMSMLLVSHDPVLLGCCSVSISFSPGNAAVDRA